MTTRDSSGLHSMSKVLTVRGGALAMLCCLGGGVIAAGCGSTTSGEPFPEFEGVWLVDTDASSLNCRMEVGLENVPFPLWGSTVTIAAGVLTDLVGTDGLCLFNYDVKGKVATVPTPDPYTGAAPTCTISVSSMDASNVLLAPDPTTPISFKLLQPVKGAAPTAQIVGSAAATVSLADATGQLQPLTPCMFAAQVKIHKLAKP